MISIIKNGINIKKPIIKAFFNSDVTNAGITVVNVKFSSFIGFLDAGVILSGSISGRIFEDLNRKKCA